MLRALSTAATGMTAQQLIVDTIANNLANMNTIGFKRSQVDFQDLMYVKLAEPGSPGEAGVVAPSGFEVGSGVRPASTLKVFTQGELENTKRELDVAIEGDGFFAVTTASGETRYTRDGSFRVNGDGTVVTSSGYALSPSITIPAGTRRVSIAADGTVSAYVGGSTTAQTLTSITLVRFANPSGLSSEGGNLLAATDASGDPTTGTPGQNGFGRILQRFREQSNVNMVHELVGLITAQRAYETNSRAIRAGDEMLNTANRLIS
ncbi:MAG: flagellar basal-body rod protein FlgG [Planctomycetota bacterium]|jgi:flagellar basal-body rod protein FlgG